MRDLKVETVDTFLGRLRLIEGDVVSRTMKDGKHWNPHVYNALAEHLDGVVIDVGANIGALTMRFAEKTPQWVVAYEPHPVVADCLSYNCMKFGSKVVIHRKGLYSRPVWLAPPSVADPWDPSAWAWLPVQGDQISGLAAVADRYDHHALPQTTRVSAIKVDAQGADLHALLGLQEVIARDHPRIVFEYEDALSKWHGHTWEDYAGTLKGWGYEIRDIGEGDWEAR